MQRRALLALVALSAALAFAAGAAAFDDAVTRSTGIGVGDGNGQAGSNAGSAERGAAPALDSGAGGCVLCGFSARSLVAGLLPRVDPAVLGGVAVLVAALAAFTGLRSRRGNPTTVDLAPEPDDAGRAGADDGGSPARPRDEPPTNDVYRAWREMRDRAAVGAPENATPSEHAAAAVSAGFDGDAVWRLTGVFRAVRYGGAPPTADRQRAARDALEALELEADA